MERKIGEIFEYNGEWYQCVENTGCKLCDFCEEDGSCKMMDKDMWCNPDNRRDKTPVIFKKLEKVGEPYEYFVQGNGIIMVQEYILYNLKYTRDAIHNLYIFDCQNGRIAIEIKQNQEDMEEKTQLPKEDNALTRLVYNYVNGKISDKELIESIKGLSDKYPYAPKSKKFDLEAAKAGKPVCTRDGRKARIICFDAKRKNGKRIIALIPSKDFIGFEDLIDYPDNGNYYGGHENDGDLMMLPEKKEGWAVIKKSDIYETEEQAKEALLDSRIGVMIRKVEWEE